MRIDVDNTERTICTSSLRTFLSQQHISHSITVHAADNCIIFEPVQCCKTNRSIFQFVAIVDFISQDAILLC